MDDGIANFITAVFMMAGASEIDGSKSIIEKFNHLKLPQWFRVITGWIEVIAAVLVIIGF